MWLEIPMQNQTLRLLHVEDDATDAHLINETLQTTHSNADNTLEITHVPNMKSALNAISKHQYDAVLLDLGLEDVSGPVCVAAIRQEAPEIPVIVLSGNEADEAALESYRNGAHEYLVKGTCNGDTMREAIHNSIYCESLIQRLKVTVNAYRR
jgi:two-component system cell cycle response regulator